MPSQRIARDPRATHTSRRGGSILSVAVEEKTMSAGSPAPPSGTRTAPTCQHAKARASVFQWTGRSSATRVPLAASSSSTRRFADFATQLSKTRPESSMRPSGPCQTRRGEEEPTDLMRARIAAGGVTGDWGTGPSLGGTGRATRRRRQVVDAAWRS
ncbi:hypothetical protein CI784_13510 [Arthrobacter agilis]|nr:hypothetical protein B8W74_13480 [Arthrobacter agilis]PPB45133.1 hypothetical protein CI784_13510 [Arthrobacter agilis]